MVQALRSVRDSSSSNSTDNVNGGLRAGTIFSFGRVMLQCVTFGFPLFDSMGGSARHHLIGRQGRHVLVQQAATFGVPYCGMYSHISVVWGGGGSVPRGISPYKYRKQMEPLFKLTRLCFNNMCCRQGRYEEAEPHLHEAVQLFERVHGALHPRIAYVIA